MKKFDRKTPYNDLPPLPPTADIETKDILRKTISAGRILAQLNGAWRNLPNPTLFLDTIYLQEAKASSEVENIITTNDELYQSLVADKNNENPATKEVLRYKEALWLGLEELKTKPFITTNLCIKIVQCIKQNSASIRVTPGTTLRTAQGKVIYTPPTGEDVIREKMADLEKFINASTSLSNHTSTSLSNRTSASLSNQSEIDPLIKMALLHYQFEAIHPFADGNGRTGRILLLLYLKLSGLLDIPAIYLSEYIIKNRIAYYQKLQGVTEKNEWEPFILYMLDMVETTAKSGFERLNLITTTMEQVGGKIKNALPKVYSNELIEIMFRLPYIKRQHLIDVNIGNAKTAGNYLSALEKADFLTSVKVGKEKLYLNRRLLDILEKK